MIYFIGILQMLGMLENSGYEKSGAGAAATIHHISEVMRRYFEVMEQFLDVQREMTEAFLVRQRGEATPRGFADSAPATT